MVNGMTKKLLVISYIATMATLPNGRTLQSLLQGIPGEAQSLFCCYGMPDRGSCGSCYKVTNKDAIRSLVRPSKAGGTVDLTAPIDSAIAVSNDAHKGSKKAWKYLFKELLWKVGRWKNKRLRQWLLDQKADCIVYMYGDNASLQRFARYASKLLNIPLIVYSCEDYCLKDYNYIDQKKHSLAFKLYHRMSKNATKDLFKQASGLITNSDQLGQEYKEKYGIDNVATVMMASQMQYRENAEVRPIDQIHIDYMGAIGKYRVKALIQIGQALQKIDSRLKLDVYGRIQEDNLRTQLESCDGVRYCGFVGYEQVQQVMRSSTLLIEAINDDPYVCKDKKYGFSTKYADCFACGTPLLVYAPDAIIETRFAKEHECAFVATDTFQLEDQLKRAIFDEKARRNQLQAAREVTQRYFDKDKNVATVSAMIEAVTSR